MLNVSNGRENIDFLRKLGENMDSPKGYKDITTFKTSSYMELNPGKNGKAFLFNLLHKDEIAVCNNFASKDTQWEIHHHNEWELFVVYEGSMVINIYDEDNNVEKEITLYADDIERRLYWVGPKISHSAKMLENCSFIAITIPGSSDFPGPDENKNTGV